MKIMKSSNEYDVIVDSEFEYDRNIYVRSDGYATINIKRRSVLIHRHIMNAPKGSLVDHINGNKLDNRKCNLRFASKSQNAGNMKPKKGYYPVNGRYVVQFRKKNIGTFDTKEEASNAYKKAHKEFYGEFSRY